MPIICPFISVTNGGLVTCRENCALYMDGVCAIRVIATDRGGEAPGSDKNHPSDVER